MRKVLGLIACCAMLCAGGAASASDTIETAGKVIAFGLPVAAAGITWSKGDERGLSELALSWTTSVGTAYLISQVVREKRPDGSDYQSFPSDTAASGYSAAGYLWARYGWRYGVPAYAMAMFAGYSRTEAKKHHWYDVLASSAIAFGANYAFVDRYHPEDNTRVSLDVAPDEVGVHLSYNW